MGDMSGNQNCSRALNEAFKSYEKQYEHLAFFSILTFFIFLFIVQNRYVRT